MEALHPSATCRSARVIHGGHFESKSRHKSVCHEKESDNSSRGRRTQESSMHVGDAEKAEENLVQKLLHQTLR